jgi:hypothetical protein
MPEGRVVYWRDDEEPRLDRVLECIWDMLEAGVARRNHGFHTPILATLGPGGAPDARTVVLRQAQRGRRMLRLHSDARSDKIAHMRDEPRIALNFYDPSEQTQVRIAAVSRLHERDSFADEAWAALSPMSRRCYLAQAKPGSETDWPDSGLPPDFRERRPSEAESHGGRANFVAVECEVTSIDWLYLTSSGNRRAKFAWTSDGRPLMNWLMP